MKKIIALISITLTVVLGVYAQDDISKFDAVAMQIGEDPSGNGFYTYNELRNIELQRTKIYFRPNNESLYIINNSDGTRHYFTDVRFINVDTFQNNSKVTCTTLYAVDSSQRKLYITITIFPNEANNNTVVDIRYRKTGIRYYCNLVV